MTDPTNPKPTFSEVGRFYDAVVAAGIAVGTLNRDRADSLVRILARTNWKDANLDIYRIWNTGGDPWGQLIKDVRSYAQEVSRHKRLKK